MPKHNMSVTNLLNTWSSKAPYTSKGSTYHILNVLQHKKVTTFFIRCMKVYVETILALDSLPTKSFGKGISSPPCINT